MILLINMILLISLFHLNNSFQQNWSQLLTPSFSFCYYQFSNKKPLVIKTVFLFFCIYILVLLHNLIIKPIYHVTKRVTITKSWKEICIREHHCWKIAKIVWTPPRTYMKLRIIIHMLLSNLKKSKPYLPVW